MKRRLQGLFFLAFLVFASGADSVMEQLGIFGFSVIGWSIVAAMAWSTLPGKKGPRRMKGHPSGLEWVFHENSSIIAIFSEFVKRVRTWHRSGSKRRTVTPR